MRRLDMRGRLRRSRLLNAAPRAAAAVAAPYSPLLLPGIELGLLVLLVLRILLHRRSWPHQRMSVLRSRRMRHRMLPLDPSARLDVIPAVESFRGAECSAIPSDDCWPSSTTPADAKAGWPASSAAAAAVFQLVEPPVALAVAFAGRETVAVVLVSQCARSAPRVCALVQKVATRRRWLPGCNYLPVHYRGRRFHGYRASRSHHTLRGPVAPQCCELREHSRSPVDSPWRGCALTGRAFTNVSW